MGCRTRLAFGGVTLAYLGLRVATFLPAAPRRYPDTGTYLSTAAHPVISLRFLAGDRPWTLPLLYKVLPDSDAVRAAAQLGISIACWLALAAAVAWCVRGAILRVVAFSVVLLFSLSVWVTQWDAALLSESVAVSLTALLLAAWLALVRAPSPWTVAAVLAATGLWTFTRDTSAYVSLLAVPFVVGWAARPGRRREAIALAVGLVAVFAAGALSMGGPATPDERWSRPLRNVIGQRVLTDADELRYFRAHGMPTPPVLLALRGKQLGAELGPASPLRDDRRLAPFRAWVHDHGRQTLTRYLLTHPRRALEPVVRHRYELLAANPRDAGNPGGIIARYRPAGADDLLPGPLAAAAYPTSVKAVVIWLAIALAAGAWLAWRRELEPIWLVPAIALLLQLPHAAIVWSGDTVEIVRHAVLVGLMSRLSLLVLSIFVLDAALGSRRRRSGA